MESTDGLVAGCALGEVVVLGSASEPLFETPKSIFGRLMQFVERNDFHAILEVTRRTQTAGALHCKCKFTVMLGYDGYHRDFGPESPDEMTVTHATLLHYALCICKFDAAAALLVVHPEFLLDKCQVEFIKTTTTTRNLLLENCWSTIEITSFLCSLYAHSERSSDLDTDEVQSTLDEFRIVFLILSYCQCAGGYGLLFGQGRQAERIAAAGFDPDLFTKNVILRLKSLLPCDGEETQVEKEMEENALQEMAEGLPDFLQMEEGI